jgi:hypothetical protein
MVFVRGSKGIDANLRDSSRIICPLARNSRVLERALASPLTQKNRKHK